MMEEGGIREEGRIEEEKGRREKEEVEESS